jgi:2-succinyl-6-hydroxy-2,4-cyclohexadiene-1-carboxylate synthase
MAAARVIFIPGFMQRGDAWEPVAALLRERYPSVLLEHREHTCEGRLEEIAFAGEGGVLVGYSLGGRLALRAVLRAPDRFRGLVTVGSTAGLDEPAARSARREDDEKFAAWIEVMSIQDVVALWERQPMFADQSEALIERQRPGRLSHDPRELALLLRTAGQGALDPVWHELEQLDLPLLAIAGARDPGYKRAAERIAATAPKGRAAIVEEAGHAAHLQRPDEVARVVEEFLDGLE